MPIVDRRLFRLWASALLMESKGRLRFFTLTVKENSLPLRIVAARWRRFCNSRWWRSFMHRGGDYIVVYEPHPNGHGWHIHCLTNFYIPWQELQLMANVAHFGHTDIASADNQVSFYMVKYINKAHDYKRLQDSKYVRIVNVSRGLLSLKDVQVNSPSIDFVRSNWDKIPALHPLRRVQVLRLCWLAMSCKFYGLHPYCDRLLSTGRWT